VSDIQIFLLVEELLGKNGEEENKEIMPPVSK
jgi:hypothetical protein